MSDELKAAVNRLRKCELNSTSWDSGLEPTYRKDYTLFGRDMNVLAHAYLADHLADDDEPVTEEWLRIAGFENRSFLGHGKPLCVQVDITGQLSVYLNGVVMLSIMGHYERLAEVHSRGDVRHLCRALGIEAKEIKESPA